MAEIAKGVLVARECALIEDKLFALCKELGATYVRVEVEYPNGCARYTRTFGRSSPLHSREEGP